MAARKEQRPYEKCAWAPTAVATEKYKMSLASRSQPAYLERGDDYGDESDAISEYQKQIAQQSGQSSVELDIGRPPLHTRRDRELTEQVAELKKAVDGWSDWNNHGWSDWDWSSGHDDGWDQGWSWTSRGTVGLMMDGTNGDHDRSRGYNDSDGVILLHD